MHATDLYPAVPVELKDRCQWVVWRQEVRDGKPTKVPYQINGRKARSNTPSTWTDYLSVCRAYKVQTVRVDGIGFVFTDADPYCGIDLDDCFYENRSLKPWAILIVDKLKCVGYGEVSPSGYGIKFWTRAMLPADSKNKIYLTIEGNVCGKDDGDVAGAIEAYDRGRYFTVTGKGKYDILDGQQVVDWLYEKYLKPQPKVRNNTQSHYTLNLSDSEVVAKIHQSKQSHRFEALMRGDTNSYGSSSEADLALCGIMAFWTQDIATIDTIFRQSALMREKWDEKHRSDGATYGQMTIEKALANRTETYTPPRKRRTGKRLAYLAKKLNRRFSRG